MFPTAGYFRNVPCPFYIHGLCHRPYCHFRHSKPDTKGKRSSSADWTYGEVVEENASETTTASKAEEQLMNIIRNLSPGKKQLANTGSKKSVSFSLFVQEQVIEEDKNEEVTASGTAKQSTKDLETRRKDQLKEIEEANSDPIPAPIVKEISDLLKITSANDQSTQIAEDVRRRKRSKIELEIANTDQTENKEIKQQDEQEKAAVGKIFDSLEDAVPKKPPKLKDINFFDIKNAVSPKKVKKKRKLEISDRHLSKHDSSVEQIDSSVESSSESVDNSEATLRCIFEEYDPLVDGNGVEESKDTVRVKKDINETVENPLDYISNKVKVTVGPGSLKKRISHNPNIEEIRQPVSKKGLTRRSLVKPSFVSPSISNTSKVPASKIPSPNCETETINKRRSFTANDGTYIGKKRKAHALEIGKESSETKDFNPPKKPKLPVEFGSKVPQVIRQRYLDKIIDEYTGKYKTLQEVYEKALEEEKLIHTRCSSRQIYMNLCVNAIKRIRELPSIKEMQNGNSAASTKPNARPLSDTSSKIAAKLAATIAPPKVVIRPSSISLAKLDKKHSSLTGNSKEAIDRKTKMVASISDLTEDVFYEHMLKYLASAQELWDNNYPKESSETPGLAIYREMKGSLHPTKRTCARCGKPFQLNSEGEYENQVECNYHWGKLRRFRARGGPITQFSCCQGDAGSVGCSVAKLHVSDYFGDLDDYVATKTHNKTNTRKVYALDCEMCYTSHGLELTRVTIVDFSLKQILDAFVQPDRNIVDYNTRFSGVTEKDLRGVQITLKDVHRKLLKKFGTDTILIGHSLESDLRALKLIHNKVVDTALIFPHRLGLPYKRALKTLMGEFLQKIIQDSDGGHDSYEDSASCMELMRWKVIEDLKKQARTTVAHVR